MLRDQTTVGLSESTNLQKTKVLIVDDDHAIRRFLRTSLTAHGYEVYTTATGEDAIIQTINVQPELIILDLGLPGIDGIEVTKRIREWSQTPIVILSVQNQDTDKIEALDAGADDYLTKPFSMGELTARLRVAMRHIQQDEPVLIFYSNKLRIDFTARIVTYDGVEVQLTPTEYDLLKVLAQHAGRVLTHQQLLREVWGAGAQTDTHLLRVHMSNLRHKIEEDPTNPEYILTEPGVGYRLRLDV
ncbi:MAG: response regulator transcription factor [Candidatus Promineifilaceae bacterium]|nr:response regulator transcription factor [Anaerolineaceae bacterium]